MFVLPFFGLARLVGIYPSHEFVIDFREAKMLFKNISRPNENESKLGNEFYSESLTGLVEGNDDAVIKHIASGGAGQDSTGNQEAATSARTGAKRSRSRPSGNGSRVDKTLRNIGKGN